MKVYKLNENARIPEYATEGSACFDIRACLEGNNSITSYNPHNRELQIPVKDNGRGGLTIQIHPQFRALVPTGLIFSIPNNHVLKMYPRSGFALKFGITLANCVPIIDSDYVEETFVMLYNMTDTPIQISHDDRICQAMLEKVIPCKLEETTKRPSKKTDRDGGLGSTGTN